ncbi:pumilio domain member 6 [Entophlyctis sp. JEL0112]|nr:pumilio domain member 6 [Entophlyctis sp. JEL0112]
MRNGVKKAKTAAAASSSPDDDDVPTTSRSHSADEADDLHDLDEQGDWDVDGDGQDDDEDANDNDADTDTANGGANAQKSARASRIEQKAIALERRKARPNGSLVITLKKLWEVIRLKKLDSETRAAKMDELMGLITGKIQEELLEKVTFRHDAARVIQSALKHGNQKQREIIAQELKGKYAVLACSQYGRFIVSKILNLCPSHRAAVLKEFQGQVRKLMRHRDASFVIEEAYSQFANASQRNSLMEEFYGPEFALFKSESGKSLQTILAENPSKKPAILKNMKEAISSFLEKSAANIGPHTIIHRLILDYLLLLPSPSAAETEAASGTYADRLIDLLKDHLVHILHTSPGSRVAQLTLLHATPKDRKYILKTFKTLVSRIACDQHGCTVLVTMHECVDDTVATRGVFAELSGAPGLFRDAWGSKVLLYLLKGRSALGRSTVESLETMDSVRRLTSKKDDALRRQEVVGGLLGSWVETCVRECADLMRTRSGSQIVVEVLRTDGFDVDKSKLIDAVASLTSGTLESYSSSLSATSQAPFNAAKKLAADATAAKAAQTIARARDDPDVPDISQHALVNRQATFAIKDAIAGPRTSTAVAATGVDRGLSESCAHVALAVARTLGGAHDAQSDIHYWLKYIAREEKAAGVTFVLVALLESAAEGVTDALLGPRKERKKRFSHVLADLENFANKAEAAAAKGAEKAGKNGKRKREDASAAEGKSGERESGLRLLIRRLKESF